MGKLRYLATGLGIIALGCGAAYIFRRPPTEGPAVKEAPGKQLTLRQPTDRDVVPANVPERRSAEPANAEPVRVSPAPLSDAPPLSASPADLDEDRYRPTTPVESTLPAEHPLPADLEPDAARGSKWGAGRGSESANEQQDVTTNTPPAPQPERVARRPEPEPQVRRPVQPPAIPVRREPEPEVVTHAIVDGDSLQSLAARYLGAANRYLEIYENNRDKLDHPDLLPIDEVLEIRLVAPPTALPSTSDPGYNANPGYDAGHDDGLITLPRDLQWRKKNTSPR